MVKGEEMSGNLEWTINMPNGKSKILGPERGLVGRTWEKLKSLVVGFVMKIWKFLVESWKIGVAEPKKFIHCIKVGLALSVVSTFYYMRPLYQSVGGNAMWAIMTVVVVFEYMVGTTICKSVNRAIATIAAGSLGVGVHWIAGHCGEKYEPIVIGASVFIFASAATFSRFIPTVKARFDYGAMIFILTFSFVSVSGYRVDNLIILAQNRVSTIAIGTSLCVLISMLFWPVWAGDQLHHQTISNLEKLANSLEGYVAEYFSNGETPNISEEDLKKKILGYKCVLNSKASEESMANFARWEPAHGHFYFGYPWKQYLKIGAAARNCAYCIDNISSCVDSEMQAPEFLKNYVKDRCINLSFCSSKVLKEAATAIKTRRKSSSTDFLVHEMNSMVQDLHDALKSFPTIRDHADRDGEKIENLNKELLIAEILPLGTFVTLLIETAARIEDTSVEVDKLATMAKFKTQKEKRPKQNELTVIPCTNSRDQEAMKTLEMV
ncbi:hypothetical protein Cgig2_030364 [Carnegiea gigantea]|uniref:Aluminum-activated malate transporter 10 n=1 Tax=Carnegiea gigantea TaxID=171969 RepID=A0A9Q1QLR1_9CARY|nr:hypothetical protein Cgig2_030364 [Carnegiea gigantea]